PSSLSVSHTHTHAHRHTLVQVCRRFTSVGTEGRLCPHGCCCNVFPLGEPQVFHGKAIYPGLFLLPPLLYSSLLSTLLFVVLTNIIVVYILPHVIFIYTHTHSHTHTHTHSCTHTHIHTVIRIIALSHLALTTHSMAHTQKANREIIDKHPFTKLLHQ